MKVETQTMRLYMFQEQALLVMSSFSEQVESLKKSALEALNTASNLASLEEARVTWLGSNSQFNALLRQLGKLPAEERPTAGKVVNQAKAELVELMDGRKAELELKAAVPSEATDFTLPGRQTRFGGFHPLTRVTQDIIRIF